MNWRDQAACAGMDTSIFFPQRGENFKQRYAQQICNQCDVILECRQHSIELAQQYDVQGIFGGWTQKTRVRYMQANGMVWHRSGYHYEVHQ